MKINSRPVLEEEAEEIFNLLHQKGTLVNETDFKKPPEDKVRVGFIIGLNKSSYIHHLHDVSTFEGHTFCLSEHMKARHTEDPLATVSVYVVNRDLLPDLGLTQAEEPRRESRFSIAGLFSSLRA